MFSPQQTPDPTSRWYEDNEPESIAIPDYENRILEQVR